VCGFEALGGTKQAGAKAESGRQKATG